MNTTTRTVQVIDGTRSGAFADLLLEETTLAGELDLEALKRWAVSAHGHLGFTSAGVGVLTGELVEVVLNA